MWRGEREAAGGRAAPPSRGPEVGEREERNTVESERDGESETEISRRRRWGEKTKGSEGRADGPRVTVKFGNLRSPADSSSRMRLGA